MRPTSTPPPVDLPPLRNAPGEMPDLDSIGIYRLFDAEGALLYVGRTRNVEQRMRNHRFTQPWWPEVASMEWIPVANYAEAVALERDCIEREGPQHNGNGHVAPRAAVESLPREVEIELLTLYAASDDGVSEALDSYILALREAGWFLNTIAAPLGITPERVRQRAAAAKPDPSIAVPARVRPRRKSDPKKWPTLTEAERVELAELAPVAAMCRGRMPSDHPARIASERLSELFAEYVIRGVRRREIAEAAGLTEAAVNRRLQSHGYYKTPPSVGKYGCVTSGTRSTHCLRGHELSGDNLRLVNGDPSRRTCRACERIRTANYLARKRARQEGVAA